MAHPWCLDIFFTPQHLQNMPFIAYGGARPSTRPGHVCSCLFNEIISDLPTGWPHDHGPTKVGGHGKTRNKASKKNRSRRIYKTTMVILTCAAWLAGRRTKARRGSTRPSLWLLHHKAKLNTFRTTNSMLPYLLNYLFDFKILLDLECYSKSQILSKFSVQGLTHHSFMSWWL